MRKTTGIARLWDMMRMISSLRSGSVLNAARPAHLAKGLPMSNLFGTDTVILAGYGFSADGPYLTVNDLADGTVQYVPVLGRTFSLCCLPRRHCIGRFNLQTYEKSVCPLNVELLPDSKEDMCPACIEATGFNPSFYFSNYVSPQQREYNQTPHYVYLAYFAPGYLKAGISSETRGIERLLEQGARAASVVGRFSCADDARALEAALCAQDGVAETMRASLKTKLLVEAPFDFDEACRELAAASDKLDDVPAVAQAGFAPEDALDLSPYYFGGPSPDVHNLQRPAGDEFANVCGGVCAGMVGANLVFWQDGTNFVTPIKHWESHEIAFLDDEVACEYAAEPQQISLF